MSTNKKNICTIRYQFYNVSQLQWYTRLAYALFFFIRILFFRHRLNILFGRPVNLSSTGISPLKQLSPFFVDEIRRNIDNGLLTGEVFTDLKKAFDTIDHHILLNKLQRYVAFVTRLFFGFPVICKAVPNV